MSDELDKIVDNVSEPSFWFRILFMVAFAIASYFIILPLIIVLSVAQMLFTLITGQVNANLRYFSATLALYVPQVMEYLTYLSEEKPYPFSDLPEVEDDSLQQESSAKAAARKTAENSTEKSASETQPAKKPAVAKKSAPAKAAKKKPAKKKAAKKKAAKKAAKSVVKSEEKPTDAVAEDSNDS